MSATDGTDGCYAHLQDGVLTVGNRLVERRWALDQGLPRATSCRDLASGREWIAAPGAGPGIAPPGPPPRLLGAPRLTLERGRALPVEEPSLVAELAWDADGGPLRLRFQVFHDCPGVAIRLVEWPAGPGGSAAPAHGPAALGSGIEDDAAEAGGAGCDLLEHWAVAGAHLHLTQVAFADHTDRHDNLVQTAEYRLYAPERLELAGNLFVLEDPLAQEGLVLLKLAPLPHARPLPGPSDLASWPGAGHPARHGLSLRGHGTGYAWSVLCWRGGAAGRTAALHRLQRCLRTYLPGRDGLFLANTWGDRNRDGRVCAAFMAEEIARAPALGVETVQIDDGWQRGTTANSVHRAAGGVWQGFWASDPQFWRPHPQRFPDGLAGTAAAARARGLGLGLWYAPDSADEFANWERDADTILALWREHGVAAVKADSIKATTALGEARLRSMFARIMAGSGGAVAIDLDVTSGIRPGYFGAIAVGPLFLENRYTDLGRYWPHATLRNLWRLAAWVDPVRLRVELLNQLRCAAEYGDDPLAPARYASDWLFASVMVASPLAWCELSGLPQAAVDRLTALVAVWKRHREALHRGRIAPAGACPDGRVLSGFTSTSEDGRSIYVIALRSLGGGGGAAWPLPVHAGWSATHLAGDGRIAAGDGCAQVSLPGAFTYAFARLEAPP